MFEAFSILSEYKKSPPALVLCTTAVVAPAGDALGLLITSQLIIDEVNVSGTGTCDGLGDGYNSDILLHKSKINVDDVCVVYVLCYGDFAF
jgi:hypothetical protein